MKEENMIEIYYRKRCKSSEKAILWLEKHKIVFRKQKINTISSRSLIDILTISNLGFLNILKKNRSRENLEFETKVLKLMDMNFNESILFLKKNTDIIQTPIITDWDNILIGYNEDEIRMFISSDYRKIKFKSIYK